MKKSYLILQFEFKNEKWFEIIIFPYSKFFKTNMKWTCLLLFHFFSTFEKTNARLVTRIQTGIHFLMDWKEKAMIFTIRVTKPPFALFFTLDIGFKKPGKWNCHYCLLPSAFKFYRKKMQITKFHFSFWTKIEKTKYDTIKFYFL